MKLTITVEEIRGQCPAYREGDRIVLDRGYQLDLAESTALCMHSMGAVLPFYNALAKGIPASKLGLAGREWDGKAYVQCPDACERTGGGTFWPRLLARNPNYAGRRVRIRTAYLAGAWDESAFRTRLYVTEKHSIETHLTARLPLVSS